MIMLDLALILVIIFPKYYQIQLSLQQTGMFSQLRLTQHILSPIKSSRLLRCCRPVLSNFPRVYFSSRHSKAQPTQQWTTLDAESMVSQLQILYETTTQRIEGDHPEIQSQLTEKIKQMNENLQAKMGEYMTYVSQHEIKINKYLQSIDMNSTMIKNDLLAIVSNLEKYCINLETKDIPFLRSKFEILSFLYSSMVQHHVQHRLLFKLAYIIEVEIKLKSLFTYFNLYQNNESNITNSHPRLFPHVWQHIYIQRSQNHRQIHSKYKYIGQLLNMAGGAISKSGKYGGFKEKLMFNFSFLQNYIKYEYGLLNSLQLYKNPTIDSCQKFLNIYEHGLLKHISSYSYPQIKTNVMMYIPAEGDFPEDLDIFKQNKNFIAVRILHHEELPLLSKVKEISEGKDIEDIIVHIHGGGFVALSSHTTQSYTRTWANGLKIPLFSIDYRMPPTHPFPYAPNDCFQVYKFLINRLHKYMKIKPKNVYICGDSAGGNLSCSLTALAMKNGLLKPKGLFLAYPTVDSRQIYYPSRKYILNDPLLWPSMAQIFFTSYIQDQEQRSDCLASPILLTQQYIGGHPGDTRFPTNWPITYIVVGSKDPLRDESLMMMQRMVESGVKCKCYIFEHLRHAIFSCEKLIQEGSEALKHSVIAFKEMIEQSKKDDYL